MEIAFGAEFFVLVVVIIIIIVLAVVLFRARFPTEEERHENRSKLLAGIAVAILVAIGLYLLYVYYMPKMMHHSHQRRHEASAERREEGQVGEEYGVFSGARDWWDRRKAIAAAKKEAKQLGGSRADIEAAARRAKSSSREAKRAGQEAKYAEVQVQQKLASERAEAVRAAAAKFDAK